MAIIGTFTLAADGKLSGNLKTLTLSTKLQFVPETNKSKDSAPDFRIYLEKVEVGAAWTKVGRESGREYWSVKLDEYLLNPVERRIPLPAQRESPDTHRARDVLRCQRRIER